MKQAIGRRFGFKGGRSLLPQAPSAQRSIDGALLAKDDVKDGYWLTPPDLWDSLQEEFAFDYDPCPFPRPAGYDGLAEDWGSRSYVNPPGFRNMLRWARKATTEAAKGKTVAFVGPIERWHDHLLANGAESRTLGPVRWLNRHGKPLKDEPLKIGLFILRPPVIV